MSYHPESIEAYSGIGLSDTQEPVFFSVNTCLASGKDSFYNRMRLDIAELMDSVDFSLLGEPRRPGVTQKCVSNNPKFQLSSLDDYLHETIKTTRPPQKKPNVSRVQNSTTPILLTDSRHSMTSVGTPKSRVHKSASIPAKGGRLFKEPKNVSQSEESISQSNVKKTTKRAWIRIEDIPEVPCDLHFEAIPL